MMKAAVLTAYGRIEWMDVPDPAISASEVLVKVSCAGICGTDQHIFQGEFHPRTSLPLIMGHEFAGRIVQVGKAVSGYKVGDRVAVDPIYWCGQCPACEHQHYPACSSLKLLGVDAHGGFGQYVAVQQFMLYKLSPSIPDRHAALIEVLSIGFHACQRAGLQPGDSLAVFGAGRIGQCILQAARTITDNTIYLVDILPTRLALAEKTYDNLVTINALEQDPVVVVQEQTQGRGVDVAIEAVGHAHSIEGRGHPVAQCVKVIRGAGTVCVLGLSDDPVPLVMKELIWKEARLVTSRVTHGEFKQTIEHLDAGNLHPDALISCEMPAGQASEAFERLAKHPQDYLKILLTMQ
jgi:threonine dehydrogenase-like Zn-dependent dehydrogenase